jgi:hypothetical protein
MEVENLRGEKFELTKDEEKFLKAIIKLEKLRYGRLHLFGSGTLTVRLGGNSSYRIIHSTQIYCEGGDGGDDFD